MPGHVIRAEDATPFVLLIAAFGALEGIAFRLGVGRGLRGQQVAA